MGEGGRFGGSGEGLGVVKEIAGSQHDSSTLPTFRR